VLPSGKLEFLPSDKSIFDPPDITAYFETRTEKYEAIKLVEEAKPKNTKAEKRKLARQRKRQREKDASK